MSCTHNGVSLVPFTRSLCTLAAMKIVLMKPFPFYKSKLLSFTKFFYDIEKNNVQKKNLTNRKSYSMHLGIPYQD